MASASLKRRFLRILKTTGILLLVAAGLSLILDQAFFRGHGFPPPHLKTAGLFAPRPVREGTWALLINGGVRATKNYPRYWNNISLVFCTLKSLGWQHISVLSADGLAPEPDRMKRAYLGMLYTGGLLDSPADLDFDGRPDVGGAATRTELEKAIAGIGRAMRPGDSLFIFITDHGTHSLVQGRRQPVAGLWGDLLSGEDFQAILAAHLPETSWTAILAAQCWSVKFLRKVTRPKTLLMASGHPNWIWSSQDYSIFPQLFCEALLRRKVFTGRPLGSGDGASNFREAFASARKRDHTPEWPLLWVNGDPDALPDLF